MNTYLFEWIILEISNFEELNVVNTETHAFQME